MPQRRLEAGGDLSFLPGNNRTRGISLKFHQGRFRMDSSENFFVKHWNRLPRGMVGSQNFVAVVLRHVVWWQCWGNGWTQIIL